MRYIARVVTFLSFTLAVCTQVIASYEAYEHALGVRSVNFYRMSVQGQGQGQVSYADALASSQLMAVGSYDGRIRLLSTRSWQVLMTRHYTYIYV